MKQVESRTTNGYFIDVESGDELARLIEQDRLITAQMGLFPAPVHELFPLFGEQEYRVLDLACGPGGWALEAAYQVPELEVIGVDIAPSMIEYAALRANTQELSNVSFEVMDITKPLTFRDASFQYIHARFLVGFMQPAQWLPLMQECRRLLAPGGTLCLTESEWPLTNSRAYEQLKRMVTRALWLNKQCLSPDGQDFGVVPRLGWFLRAAHYQQIQQHSVALEWSAGTELHRGGISQSRVAFALLRPFVLKNGMATLETYDGLYQQMLDEVSAKDFCGVTAPLRVWGQRPATTTRSMEPQETGTGQKEETAI